MSYLSAKKNGSKTDPSGFGLDVKRFYLGVDHNFDDIWSANLTTDFNYVSADSETQVFVKKAYVQAKISDAAVVRAGSADLPWVPFVEDLYGYRYVENTLIDRLEFGTSADWGLHFGGKAMGGMVNYAVSAVNGRGYKDFTRSKSVDFEGRVGVTPIKDLTLAVGVRDGKLGQDTYANSASNTNLRWDLVAAYRYNMFSSGAEYFNAKNPTTASITGSEVKADGFSVWGAVNPMEKVAVFARFDHANLNKDAASKPKDTYYNVGVSYQARKGVDLALVYKHEKNDSSAIKSDEFGVWSQVKF